LTRVRTVFHPKCLAKVHSLVMVHKFAPRTPGRACRGLAADIAKEKFKGAPDFYGKVL